MLEVHDQIALAQLTEIDLCAMAFRAPQPPAPVRSKSAE